MAKIINSNSNKMHQDADTPPPIRITAIVGNKRELLWNIIEPGDPYDIRKYSEGNKDQ